MLPLPLALLHQLQSLLTIKKVNIMPLWKDSKKVLNSFGKWPIKTTAKVLKSFFQA
jgi:hypothetical protein